VKGGKEVLIGIYDTTNQSVAFFDNFDREVVPKDSFDLYYKRVPTWVGILVAVSDLLLFTLLLSITISWRNRPEIKSASLPLLSAQYL
jgi:hypothetical protein